MMKKTKYNPKSRNQFINLLPEIDQEIHEHEQKIKELKKERIRWKTTIEEFGGFITMEQMQREAGISRQAIQKHIKNGKFRQCAQNYRWYSKADFDKWMTTKVYHRPAKTE